MSETWNEEQARWVFRRAATLAAVGAEPVGPFVLPDARFFPDRFDGSPLAVGRLFDRLKGHVGLDEVPAEVVLVDAEAGKVVSSCSGGSCGTGAVTLLAGQRVSETGQGYVVQLATTEVRNPTVLTTVLAGALGHVFLREVDALAKLAPRERGPGADLAATMLGLGVLVANGSGIEVKGCGGVKVHAATSLSAPEAVLALAVACEREERRRGPETARQLEGLARHLDPVAGGLFPLARAFARANADVVRRLDDAPEAIERGDFRLREPGDGVGAKVLRVLGLGGLLGSRPREVDAVDELERELARSPRRGAAAPRADAARNDPERRAKLAELRALVDETLDGRG